MSREKFSDRFVIGAEQIEIKVRYEAPADLRNALPVIAEEHGLTPSPLRNIICKVLLKSPDPSNWSEYPNILSEVNHLVANCKWYEVYDIIEAIYAYLNESTDNEAEKFERNINNYFFGSITKS